MQRVPIETPAAIACPLNGAYLIEASAGTGKTWTLTGIVLRLLIEKNTPPGRVLATTFTRAAAQEMQERIGQRLLDFDACCQWLEGFWANYTPNGEDLDDEQFWRAAIANATLSAVGDPINAHLLLFLCKKGAKRLSDNVAKTRNLTQTLLRELDNMFVGTLDSLAQKWLREFAHEIGEFKESEILGNVDEFSQTLAHDALRALHSAVYHESKTLHAIVGEDAFGDPKAMSAAIGNAFQFYLAPIDPPPVVDEARAVALKERLQAWLLRDLTAFAPWTADRCLAQGMSKKGGFAKRFDCFLEIAAILRQDGLQGFGNLSKDQSDWLLDLEKMPPERLSDPFNKTAPNKDAALKAWQSLPLEALSELGAAHREYRRIHRDFAAYLKAEVAKRARDGLEPLLSRQKKTSFGLQMQRLIEALQGRQGRLLARHIRHLYPVALIDEAQDINGEQARLLQLVYLDLPFGEKKAFFERAFLLLVGDPKQAIYRFRGGDVANYNALKRQDLNCDYALSINRRSRPEAVEAINRWFGKSSVDCPQDASSDFANLGEGIEYKTAYAQSDAARFVASLAPDPIVLIDAQSDAAYACAKHIAALLQSGAYFEGKDGVRSLRPSDIAVLVSRQKDAQAIKERLAAFGVDVEIADRGNVFVGKAADALRALFEAAQDASDAKLGAVLVEVFFCSLEEAQARLQDMRARAELLRYLKEIQTLWYDRSLLQALVFAFAKPPFAQKSLWERWASFEGAKARLADLWRLFEIVSVWPCHPSQALALMAKCAQSDDERYMRSFAPRREAVAAMTIHKSKGLEFPVVYILGLDQSPRRAADKLYPYTDPMRRLSPCAHKSGEDRYFADLDAKEEDDEKKRLGYVALTRAVQQIFVVAKSSQRRKSCPLEAYGAMQKGALIVPDRLQGFMRLVKEDDFAAPAAPFKSKTPKPFVYTDWEKAYTPPFAAVAHTSFSRLARLAREKFAHAHDRAAQAYAPAETQDDAREGDLFVDRDIRVGFLKGPTAGSFLHATLEAIEKGMDTDRAVRAMQRQFVLHLPTSTQAALVAWLNECLSLPFLASGAAFFALDPKKRQSEMRFTIGSKPLGGKDFANLKAIFAEHEPRALVDFERIKGDIAWLIGEIDLLYEHQGKYYVVDYKSNFLGAKPEDYRALRLEEEMNAHRYWLQAAIYQLALHRLLKLRLKGYAGNEAQHLGACEYVFLRGLSASDPSLGRVMWQAPLELILSLDAFFAL